MHYLRKYTEITKQGENYVEVEKEISKSTALGVMLKQHVYNTPSFDVNNYVSLYDSMLIQHPTNGKYAIEMDRTTGISSIFLAGIETREALEVDGWFNDVQQ